VSFIDPAPAYDVVTLERLKVGFQQRVGASVADSIQLSRWEDKIYGDLMYGLTAYVLAERLPPVTEQASKTVEFQAPAKWFQHLKQTLYRLGRKSWHRRSWLERHWPVRMKTHAQVVTLSVDLQRYRTYPEANVVLPKGYGRAINVAITNRSWLHDPL